MKIWRVPYQLQIMRAGGQERSTGFHVSDIIRDLALKSKVLDAKYGDDSTMSPERIELGIAWEERLAKHHPEICFHPGEIVVDGIAMTIDGTVYGGDEVSIFSTDDLGHPVPCALNEFKLTWKSARRNIAEEWMWMAQDKSYLHGLRASGIMSTNTVFQHIFYVNGNYSHGPDGGPSYQVFGIQFTDLEIRENWDMVLSHKKRMEGKQLTRVNPKASLAPKGRK